MTGGQVIEVANFTVFTVFLSRSSNGTIDLATISKELNRIISVCGESCNL
jgi:hypothetical protein